MSERDYAVGPNEAGDGLVLHRPDCPKVRAQADQGLPVMTMFGCEGEMPHDLRRCECLEEAR